MSISSESAEQMTRMMLQGSEVAVKITGKGAKEILGLIMAILKDQQQTKGKTRLTNMLKSGKELKIFSLSNSDLKKFATEAKRYGVLYTALVDKKNKNFDGMVDIMVRAEDVSKINRIVERFKISTMDETKVKTEIQKDKQELNKEIPEKSLEQKIEEETTTKPLQKEGNENSTPKYQKSMNENQSKHSSRTLNKSEEAIKPYKKKSVRQELKDIKNEMKKQSDKITDKSKELISTAKNIVDKTR